MKLVFTAAQIEHLHQSLPFFYLLPVSLFVSLDERDGAVAC